MRPDAEYLKELSHPSKEFDATRFVNRCLLHEIDQLHHAAIHSSLHAYVVQHGYPIPSDQLQSTSYVNRVGLEQLVAGTIASGQNLYLIGCEGSGKTTLLHYVISTHFPEHDTLFCYVDVSDIGSGDFDIPNVFYDKIRNALFLAMTPRIRNRFNDWRKPFSDDPFTADLINTSSTKRFVEALMIFLNADNLFSKIYLIIDNVDSLKSKIVEDFFALVQRLESTVAGAFHTLTLQNNDRVRFIICCRTQSIDVVTSASHGLFTRSPFKTIDMDERFVKETDVLALTQSFLKKDSAYIFKQSSQKGPIRASTGFGDVGWESFEDYSDDVFAWLARSRNEVNSTVAEFCGRSIRRSKLFLVKALASPIIARLAFFEKHKIYNITRDDPDYLKRRLHEALFDFSTASELQLPGYPLNPFGVLRDARNYRYNPLIGVATLLFLHENMEAVRSRDIHFAQSIDSRPIVSYLRAMKYDNAAIIECFHSIVLSGMLRPINGSKQIMDDENSEYGICEGYILDHHSSVAYIDLLLFKNWERSLTFYNMALRARYRIRADHHLDNMIFEVYTFLVFLFDLLDRELLLENQLEGTGVMFKPLSARIRHIVFPILPNEVAAASRDRGTRLPASVKKDQAELIRRTTDMLTEARWRLSKQAGIF